MDENRAQPPDIVQQGGGWEVVTAEALEAQERAQVDIQISTAKRYPRVLSQVQKRIIDIASMDRETAESCWYALPRGGKVIEGPSVRLAEIVASSYGNLRIASRVIGIDEKYVTCQGACHDLENNVAMKTEVRRRITNRAGKRYDDDMIMVTSNAANSIAMRNAVLKVVPMALFKAAVAEIQKVGMGEGRTLTQSRDAALIYFKGIGVSEERVLLLLQKKGTADLTGEDVATLRGMATAIREGTSTVDEMFPADAVDKKKLAAGRHSVGAKKPAKKPDKKAAKPSKDKKGTKTPEKAPEAPDVAGKAPAGAASPTSALLTTIDMWINHANFNPESFDRHCDKLGIPKEDWTRGTAVQLQALWDVCSAEMNAAAK